MPTHIEPTLEEVQAESRITGFDLDTTRQQLTSRNSAEFERFARIAPSAIESAAEEMRRAEEKLAAARAKVEARKNAIADLESRLIEFAALRKRNAEFRQEFPKADCQKLADQVFEKYFAAVASACVATSSDYNNARQALVFQQAIAPFVDDKLKALESEETATLEEIRRIAKAEKISISNLVLLLRNESGLHGNDKIQTLFAGGFFEVAD